MDSTVGQAALLLWPLVGLLLFLSLDSLTATFWTIVGGFLLLPVGVAIDFPLVPAIDKESMPPLVALLCLTLVKGRHVPLLPRAGGGRWLVVALMLLPSITVLTNPEPIFTAARTLPGLTWHDAASFTLDKYLTVLPFIIGVALVRDSADMIRITRLMVVAGLAYSLPVLFEIRMSPQLHTWLYGFFPHSFAQQLRFGGFRPVVFIGHGLTVSMFMAMVLGAAVLLWRQRVRVLGLPPAFVAVYLCLVLILCKSVGAAVLGSAMALGIALFRPSTLRTGAIVCGTVAVAYPLLSVSGLFPKRLLVDSFGAVLPERAGSLGFRFDHEDALLARALAKPWFGWGGWGRGRLDESVTDGYWIITMSQMGLLGFFCVFALLLLPIFRGRRLIRSSHSDESLISAAWVFMLALLVLDQLPNASMAAPYWLFTGCATSYLLASRSRQARTAARVGLRPRVSS